MKNKKIFVLALFAFLCFIAFKSNTLAYYDGTNVSCAALDGALMDKNLPNIVKTVILLLQIAVPVILVIFGSLDLVKGIIAQKEDEIAAGRKTFGKRLLSAVIVFFVIAAVKLVISFGAKDRYETIFNCADCFISGADSKNCRNA